MFILFQVGQQLCNAFAEIDDVIAQFDWYSFPYEIIKILPMIMITSQQSVEFKFFGSIASDRDTFKKV